jgi:hypothetical protein
MIQRAKRKARGLGSFRPFPADPLSLIGSKLKFDLPIPIPINAAPEGNGDSVFTVPLEHGRWLQENYGPRITPISEANLFPQAIQVAHEMPWEVAVEVMQNIKRAGIGGAAWFGGGYRPFFAVTAAGPAADSNEAASPLSRIVKPQSHTTGS